jgi:nucleotide-binding universal stress UspA family protein
MFRTILVPLDGSSFAEAALPIAARLARDNAASLHLALSHQPTPALVGMGVGELVAASIDLDEDQRNRERGYLVGVAAGLVLEGAGSATYRELAGPAGPAICEEATRIGADLVIMATHGRGTAGRLWHGSVADYVVRHLTVPVLLVHSEREGRRLADLAALGILVALDLSPGAEAILEPVETLARLLEAPVTLMHVMVGPVYQVGKRAALEGRLEKIAAPLRQRGLDVSTTVTTGVNVPWAIREALEDSRFGLVAMTTHGAGGLRRMWAGSVATKVVEAAVKPVLILRPSREE